MRVTYTWTEKEWREAQRLARRRSGRGTSLPGLTIGIVCIMSLGAVVDLGKALQDSHHLTLRGAVIPLVLLVCAATTCLLMFGLHRRRLRVTAIPMPAGECEAVLQDSGWSITEGQLLEAAADSATAAPTQLRPWSDMVTARRGAGVFVLLRRDGFDALPIRSLTPEQGGYLHRMVLRKRRPSA